MAGIDGGLFYQAEKKAAPLYSARDIAFFEQIAAQERAARQQQTYGGGTTVMYAEPPPPPPPPRYMDQDPTFQAFVREIDAQRNNAAANRDRVSSYVSADKGMALSDLERRSPLEIKNLQGGYESRGMFRSGAMEKALADRAAYEVQRRAQVEQSAAQRLGEIEAEYANRMLEMNQQLAAQRVQMAAAGYV